jgi:hypothetical protein
MGFMKNIAQLGASFIPGVGPLASAAIGAIGGGGKQGSQNYNSTQESTQNTNQTNSIDQTQTAIEDPAFAQFRQSLIPMMGQEMRKANQPIYGDSQKAKYLGDLNDLAQASMSSIKSSLGARGALDSGAFSQAATDVESKRFGQAADFFGQLPFQEEQARSQRMNSLMGMATNWAGRAPISTQTTGTNNITGTSTTKGNTNGTQTQQGPGFLGAFTNSLGGLMGANVGMPGTVPTLGQPKYGPGPGPNGEWS